MESNADEITGGQAIWTLTLTEYGTPRTFTARSNYWNTPRIVLLSVTAFAVVRVSLFCNSQTWRE